MSEEFMSTNPWLFTGKEKSYLRPSEVMKSGEYLFSPDGCWRLSLNAKGGYLMLFTIDPDNHNLFVSPWGAKFDNVDNCFAIMQTDGNFCIYEGSPEKQGRFLWHTNTRKGKGAHMQHDGNFCLYNYDGPSYRPGCVVWQAGFNTGEVDHYEFTSIDYDYEHMEKLDPVVVTAFTQTLKNNSSSPQKTEVSFTIKKVEKHSWQTTNTAKLGIKASATIKIPVVGETGFEISGEFTHESAEGKETSTEKSTAYTVPVVVPPMKAIKVDACVTYDSIILPYKSKGVFALKDGRYAYCELTGNFKAKSGSGLNVYYTEMDLPKAELHSVNTIELGDGQNISFIRASVPLSSTEPKEIDPSLIKAQAN